MKRFRPYHPNQLMLLPPNMREWLPADHPVYFIDDVVDQLDLSEIYQKYDEERGQPPYHPRLMVKILLYGYSRGIRSSRKIERALYEDVGFRVLAGNQQPDHWTISEFRRQHHPALGRLFVQTVELAEKAGLVALRHLAIDGTKVKANASKHAAMSYGRMKQEEERLQAEIEQWFQEADAIDREEDRRFGAKRGDELPEHLADHRKRLEAIRKAKAELEAEAREKQKAEQAKRRAEAEAKGKTYRPRRDPEKAKPKEKEQRNFTDPESRLMRTSQKAYEYGYNAQAGVDAESQVIVAADLTNQAADAPHLPSILEQAERNTGRRPCEASADAGYYSATNLSALEDREVEAFIPPDRIGHNAWRRMTSPRGRIPKNATREDRMRRKLRTKRGRERYRLRQTSAEPVFGQIKEGMGFRTFLLRGQSKARSEWRLICAVHNLMKIFRAGWKPEAAGI